MSEWSSVRASEWETEGESQNRGRSEGGPARVGVVVLCDRDSRTCLCRRRRRRRRRYRRRRRRRRYRRYCRVCSGLALDRVTLTRKSARFSRCVQLSSGALETCSRARVVERNFGKVADVGNWGKSGDKSARVYGSVDDTIVSVPLDGPVVASL